MNPPAYLQLNRAELLHVDRNEHPAWTFLGQIHGLLVEEHAGWVDSQGFAELIDRVFEPVFPGGHLVMFGARLAVLNQVGVAQEGHWRPKYNNVRSSKFLARATNDRSKPEGRGLAILDVIPNPNSLNQGVLYLRPSSSSRCTSASVCTALAAHQSRALPTSSTLGAGPLSDAPTAAAALALSPAVAVTVRSAKRSAYCLQVTAKCQDRKKDVVTLV